MSSVGSEQKWLVCEQNCLPAWKSSKVPLFGGHTNPSLGQFQGHIPRPGFLLQLSSFSRVYSNVYFWAAGRVPRPDTSKTHTKITWESDIPGVQENVSHSSASAPGMARGVADADDCERQPLGPLLVLRTQRNQAQVSLYPQVHIKCIFRPACHNKLQIKNILILDCDVTKN